MKFNVQKTNYILSEPVAKEVLHLAFIIKLESVSNNLNVKAASWHPGEQTQKSQTNRQTNRQTTNTHGRPRASGNESKSTSCYDQTDNSIKRVLPDGHTTTILLCTVQATV